MANKYDISATFFSSIIPTNTVYVGTKEWADFDLRKGVLLMQRNAIWYWSIIKPIRLIDKTWVFEWYFYIFSSEGFTALQRIIFFIAVPVVWMVGIPHSIRGSFH